MHFFEIKLKSVPDIKFAYSISMKNYSNRFCEIPRILEFGLCDEGRIVWDYDDGRTEIHGPGIFGAVTSLTKANTSLYYKDEVQRHTTVWGYADYEIKEYLDIHDCDMKALKERMKKDYIILVPTNVYLEEFYEPVLKSLRKIIDGYTNSDLSGMHETVSEWFYLARLLTKFVLSRIEIPEKNIKPSEYSYAEKAIEYIDNNYSKQLSVDEIARSLGISKGYLQRIFKKTQNMGVIEFINKKRVYVALDMIVYKNISLQEAGSLVGIYDPSYMSRLFKKVTGKSYKQYIKQLKN